MKEYLIQTFTPYEGENFYHYLSINDDENIEDYIEELEQITQAAAHEWWNEKAMVDFNNNFNAYLDQCGARILDITSTMED